MIGEREFFRSAMTGMAIAGSVAFIMLLLSTMNVRIAFFAIVSIVGIVSCVMGSLYLNGFVTASDAVCLFPRSHYRTQERIRNGRVGGNDHLE